MTQINVDFSYGAWVERVRHSRARDIQCSKRKCCETILKCVKTHEKTIRFRDQALCKSGPRDSLFQALRKISETEVNLKTTQCRNNCKNKTSIRNSCHCASFSLPTKAKTVYLAKMMRSSQISLLNLGFRYFRQLRG